MGLWFLEDKALRDTYFSLWTLTDKGINDSGALKTTIDTASAMIYAVGAKCHFYLAVGGDYDFIGVAQGEKLDDTTILAIQHAIERFGTLRTDFIKATELSLKDFEDYLSNVARFHGTKPAKPKPR